jgi:hypothetical protein
MKKQKKGNAEGQTPYKRHQDKGHPARPAKVKTVNEPGKQCDEDKRFDDEHECDGIAANGSHHLGPEQHVVQKYTVQSKKADNGQQTKQRFGSLKTLEIRHMQASIREEKYP